MNYYQHHIGDFNNATRHLTRVERSLYRDLIELYYDTECPLIADTSMLARKVIATSDEDKESLLVILSEFFTLCDDGYHNYRCDTEIEKYHSNQKAKSAAGKASAAKRKQKSTAVEQASNACATNQKPETKEPITKETVAIKPATKKTTLAEYLTECNDKGIDPIPSTDSIFEYARKVKLPVKFVELCWKVFKSDHLTMEKQMKKKQASWPMTFANYVKKGYYKLWYLSQDNDYVITTVGQQAAREHDVRF